MRARLPKQNQGGAQNMNAMIRQAQKMQDEISELQEDIESRDFTATAGGGAVSVTVTGKKTVKALEIKPEVVSCLRPSASASARCMTSRCCRI